MFSEVDKGVTVFCPRFGYGLIKKVKRVEDATSDKEFMEVVVEFPKWEGYSFRTDGYFNGAKEPSYKLYRIGEVVDLYGNRFVVGQPNTKFSIFEKLKYILCKV